MKKLFVAILFGICSMSIQTASAATLTLTQKFGDGIITTGSGPSVGGATTIGAVWSIGLSGLGSSGLADLALSLTSVGQSVTAFFNVDPITGLTAGEYFLTIIGNTKFTINATDVIVPPHGEIPIPSAVWLFGSALLGLLGACRVKASTRLAA